LDLLHKEKEESTIVEVKPGSPEAKAFEQELLRPRDVFERKRISKDGKVENDPVIFFPQAKEPPDIEDYHQMKGDSKDFMTLLAEDALKKIEEAVRKAKSLKIKIVAKDSVAPTSEIAPCDYQGSVLLKDGNRVRLEFDMQVNGKNLHQLVVCDGSTVRYGEETLQATGRVRDAVATFISRVGFFHDRGIITQYLGLDASGNCANPEKAFQLSNLKVGRDDGTAKTLTYELYDATKKVGDVRLWYDPKTHYVVKRTIVKAAPGGGGILTETYSEFSLDPDLSDNEFKPPTEK
jgi:outer membrane lipoprotein-sorting protein